MKKTHSLYMYSVDSQGKMTKNKK